MSEYQLTDEQKKRLTLFLGEKWEEVKPCPNCGYYCINKYIWCVPPATNRDFTSPQDAHDLAKKLVGIGEWGKFEDWAFEKWLKLPSFVGDTLAKWLFAEPESPVRLSYLVNSYLEEK
jgi:hypothetical protein